MSIFNMLKKKQKRTNDIPKKTSENYPTVLPIASLQPTVSNESTKKETLWKKYFIDIEDMKRDNKIKELFPEILNKLEEDLSIEEIVELVKPIQEYKRLQSDKENTISQLAYEYNQFIRKKVEENYKTGKIEEFPLCKKISSSEYKELKLSYPEDLKHLEELYLPVYKEYMEKYLFKNGSNFTNITEFINFIDKIEYYEGSIISDKEFNTVNRFLSYLGRELYGNNLFGTVKEYSFKYDNYLRIKKDIVEEIGILMNDDTNDEEKRAAVINIKKKGCYYISTTEGEYLV